MKCPEREDITGVVLAGGQSLRMGGINKALIEHEGLALFRYAVNNLLECCDHVVINAHRDQDRFVDQGFTVIDDGEFAGCGPVAGVHAALHHAVTPFVAIAACDQLSLPVEVYRTLSATVTATRGAFACSAADAVPTIAVLPTCLAGDAKRALQSRKLALIPFMREHAEAVTFNHVDFANLNYARQVRSE